MLVLRAVLVALVAATVVAPPSTPAVAGTSLAPVALDDAVVMTPLMFGVDADVLANDGDPDGAYLQVCRFDAAAGAALGLRITSTDGFPGSNVVTPGSTRLEINPDEKLDEGDYLVTYYACDRRFLTPATLTIRVRAFRATAVTGHQRVVEFANPLDRAADVYWARPGAEEPAGHLRLDAGESRRVDVGRRKVQWAAGLAEAGGDDLVPIGYGTVVADGVPLVSPVPAWPIAAARAVDDVVPPTTAPDSVMLEYYDSAEVDVLANDSDDHPEDLSVCWIDVPRRLGFDGAGLFALVHPWWADDGVTAAGGPGFVEAGASSARAGTYDLRYFACDRRNLTPGVLTVTVRRFRKPVVQRVVGSPGTVSVRNRGYRPLVLTYSPWDDPAAGRTLRVPAHETRRLHVTYDRLSWSADTTIGPLANGGVRDVQQDG